MDYNRLIYAAIGIGLIVFFWYCQRMGFRPQRPTDSKQGNDDGQTT
jgi:hypothetical protein